MRQFFLEPTATKPVQVGETVTLDRDESHHLFTVLRGGREAKLRLVDGRGNRFTGEAAGKAGKLALVRIHSAAVDEEERQTPRLVLYCAVVKGKDLNGPWRKPLNWELTASCPWSVNTG